MPDDFLALARVHVQRWDETYQGPMPDDFLTVMTSEVRRERRQTLWRHSLEADKESELVGFISGGPTDSTGYDAELFTLYLLKLAQGSGMEWALVGGLAQGLASSGHRPLMLWVLDSNSTRAFYEHLGEVAHGWTQLEALL
ncbi:GNAT family N-acetyltransferase [Deinococcus rubellus]|uniref:GNAT family N-acetyltransferase n=1 Tax=Deinococcus rubellus TaxID=1889240 RepID=A0ABY5YIB8_9DEIO|nr:GNAT family N-acetyltransferase [Deinococcus rubellus]UWX64426.1 GNAT family N-acetyltransferase [Deinococcus rubellus]